VLEKLAAKAALDEAEKKFAASQKKQERRLDFMFFGVVRLAQDQKPQRSQGPFGVEAFAYPRNEHATLDSVLIVSLTDAPAALRWARRQHVGLAAFNQGQAGHRRRQVGRAPGCQAREIGAAALSVFQLLA
jgi:hypothetical protein